MEGKGLLFKIYGGIDVFDIEVAEKDPEKFCEAVERIAPVIRWYQSGRYQGARMLLYRRTPEEEP